MELSPSASLMELRDKRLLVIHTPSGPRALEVNESFAELWKHASRGPFTREDLVTYIMREYGLDASGAAAETDQILTLCRKYGLIRTP